MIMLMPLIQIGLNAKLLTELLLNALLTLTCKGMSLQSSSSCRLRSLKLFLLFRELQERQGPYLALTGSLVKKDRLSLTWAIGLETSLNLRIG